MKSLKLEPDQKPYLAELENILQTFEDTMTSPPNDINSQLEHLNTCNSLLALQGRVMELATLIHNNMKGKLIEEFKDSDEDMKAHEFRLWADGKMARWEALYFKAERTIKSLDKYCENLRTIISAEKELSKL